MAITLNNDGAVLAAMRALSNTRMLQVASNVAAAETVTRKAEAVAQTASRSAGSNKLDMKV